MRRFGRFLFSLLKGAVIVYAMVVGILWFMQDTMLYHRSDGAPMLNDLTLLPKREIVCLTTADGLNLRSWYFRAARADRPTVLFLHGNAGDIGNHLPFAKFLIEAGYGVLALEYRGYGGNPGRPSEHGLYEDGRAHLDWLARHGLQDDALILYGESLGAAVAIEMALERKAAALVLEAPFASIVLSARARYPIFAFDWLIKDKFASVKKIDKVKMPLFIIHGALDVVTPQRFGRMLFERARGPKAAFWPAQAGHNDLTQHGMIEAVTEFLEKLPEFALEHA